MDSLKTLRVDDPLEFVAPADAPLNWKATGWGGVCKAPPAGRSHWVPFVSESWSGVRHLRSTRCCDLDSSLHWSFTEVAPFPRLSTEGAYSSVSWAVFQNSLRWCVWGTRHMADSTPRRYPRVVGVAPSSDLPAECDPLSSVWASHLKAVVRVLMSLRWKAECSTLFSHFGCVGEFYYV